MLGALALLITPALSRAHGISEASRSTMSEGGILDFIWLGSEHMLTGYDHLLFLFGVLFFLAGFRDILRFITAFTIGHCITLLGATLAGVSANAYVIDAIIAISVIYKAFENLDGFKKVFSIQAPNLLTMVFCFGLIHGFGLSTRLQEIGLGSEGMVSRILAFNVGVELGQVLALSLMLAVFSALRSSKRFEGFGNAANIGLLCSGVALFFFQVNGYLNDDHGHAKHETEHHHGTEQKHEHEHNGSNDHHGHKHQSVSPQDKSKAHDHGNGHNTTSGSHDHNSQSNHSEKDHDNSHEHAQGNEHEHEHAQDQIEVEPDVSSKKETGKEHGHGHEHGSEDDHAH